jgi:short-subunit dehydrogenase
MIAKVNEHFGRIDVLVNCAGQGYDAPTEKTNIDTFRHIFDLDVVGPLIAMECVIPLMRSQGEGAIVNISSGTALMHLPNMGAYSGMKRALAGISLTAREELVKDNIIVSVVYPYSTDTNFEKNTLKDSIPAEGGASAGRGGFVPPPPDTADYIAKKIVEESIEAGKAEVFAHDWMEKNAGR